MEECTSTTVTTTFRARIRKNLTLIRPGRDQLQRGFWVSFMICIETIWSFLVIHWIALKHVLIELCTKHVKFNITRNVIQANRGRWVVVTGGSRGIGFEVVRRLYLCQMNIIIGCRSYIQGHEAVTRLKNEFGTRIRPPSIFVRQLDLDSLASVSVFANEVIDLCGGCLHLLINNAGVMFPPYKLTEDGLDSQIQTNFIGHFALTQQLISALMYGGNVDRFARIVNVSSVAHYGASIRTYSDLRSSVLIGKNAFQSYMDSKFFQISSSIFWNCLFREDNNPIRMFNVHPGVVNTELYKHVFYYKWVLPLMKHICKSPFQGADCILFAALSPRLETSVPIFLANCKEVDPHVKVLRQDVQDIIQQISCHITCMVEEEEESSS